MNNPAFTPIKSLNGTVTGQVANQSAAYCQDLEENAFAPLQQNNQVKCFTTGREYFKAVSDAMKKAKKCIFIAGWQVNWDVELTPEEAPGERLIDILHERVQSSEDMRVYVMPWMSPKVGLNTFDLDTMLAIFQLNAGRKKMQAMCCPAGAQSDFVGTEGAAFSHHQKFVVIDNQVAFVGGIDLAYGRYDDAKFSLDPGFRQFNERYNPGVGGSHHCTPADGPALSSIDLMISTLSAGRWNVGGNTEPGALSRALHGALHVAEKVSIEAVSLVNQAARIDAVIYNAFVDGVMATASAGAHRMGDVAVAAGNAVSLECARLSIPDLYGAVKSLKVGTAATSGVPNALRNVEASARQGYNAGIDALPHFLSPLTALRVSPTPQSSLPRVAELGERGARALVNTTVDAGAALTGRLQNNASDGRTVCVEIGPAVQSGVNKTAAAVHAADAAINAGVNSMQLALITEINNMRETLNTLVFAELARDKLALEAGAGKLSQERVQKILDHLMRLCKVFYVSQLGIDWQFASAHPLLLEKGAKGRTKSAAISGKMLGKSQPRQPWQDVQAQIEGAAVYDLAMNFIGRWNASNNSYLAPETIAATAILGSPGVAAYVKFVMGKHVLIRGDMVPKEPPPPSREKPTGVAVRVLRSAPLKLCTQEAKARGREVTPKAKAGVSKVMPIKEQHEIETQMVHLIKNATDFVYIENQFYQSKFGKASIEVFTDAGDRLASGPIKFMLDQGINRLKANLSAAGFAPGKALVPENGINDALGERIAQAVRRDQPFHVYLVLPVHPEGPLNDITIAGQVHWTMQSLVFADFSLVNRVRRAIAARQLCKNTLSDAAWKQAMTDAGKSNGKQAPYLQIKEAQWCKYLTMLNLRNCQTVGGIVRTEQIYIHSKLLIVDDRHVILGSANINDRSQSGKRDSELAVMLIDTAEEKKTIRDRVTTVNTLARKLRVDLWYKHFAITGRGNEIVKPADEMKALIERPAADETIAAIQKMALDNANIYIDTFPHVPWTKTSNKDVQTGASLWPVCPSNTSAENARIGSVKMPFHDDFWKDNAPRVNSPGGIKGYLTKLATNWTIGENNHPGEMSVMALTMLEKANEQVPQPGEPTAPAQGIA